MAGVLGNRENIYQTVLDHSSDPIFCFDRSGTYLYINNAFAAPFRKKPDEIIGRRIWDIFPGEEGDKRFAAVKKCFETGEIQVIEVKVETPTVLRYYMTTVKPVFDQDESVQTVICISKDITDRKRKEDEILYLSYHDQLTGLYNRRYYDHAIKDMEAGKRLPVTLVMVDVNGLKLTNDTYGHKAGDLLLEKVGHILKRECRSDDIVARIGGDEFILLLPEIDAANAAQIISRINDAVAAEQVMNTPLSISIGYAEKRNAGDDFQEIFRQAEDAMYQQKIAGRRMKMAPGSIDCPNRCLHCRGFEPAPAGLAL